MKKLLGLCAVFLCAHQMSNAQTEKGSQTLGLNLTLAHNTNSFATTNTLTGTISNTSMASNNFNIGPAYGYFVADKSELGFRLSYGNGSQSTVYYSSGSISSNKQTNRGYGGSVYFRKYFLNESKFGFRVAPYAGYSWATNNYTANPTTFDSNAKYHTYNGGLDLDLVYFPSKKIGLAANLAGITYSKTKQDTGGPDVNTSENFNVNFINSGLSFTLFYVFGSK